MSLSGVPPVPAPVETDAGSGPAHSDDEPDPPIAPLRLNRRRPPPDPTVGIDQDVGGDGTTGSEQVRMDRFGVVRQAQFDRLRNNAVANAGLGSNVAPALDSRLIPDFGNLYARPTLEILRGLSWNAESNDVATAPQMAKIEAEFQALGVPYENIAKVMWSLARYCVSASTSPYMDPQGTDSAVCGGVSRDALVAVIRKHSTLRKVCRAYAPIMWNYMLQNEQPPENWQSKGFPPTAKYAAFDFFDYVTNEAAIQPLEGIVREPTKEEMAANEAFKKRALDKASRNDRFASLGAEVTGGMFGCQVKNDWRDARC